MDLERPLRVAHFTLGRCRLDGPNGVEQAVYHLARHQAALGHDVRVFSLSGKDPIPIPGVGVSTYPPSRPAPSLAGSLRVPPRVVADIAGWRPDMLHLHSVHVPQNVLLARRLASSTPYCVTLHGGLLPVAQNRNRWAKRMFRLLLEERYLRQAAFIHAISEREVQSLEGSGMNAHTVLAPNGIDVQALGPCVDGAREELAGHLREKRVFLSVGRLDPEVKGLDVLLRAFAASRPDNAVLLLAGPDWRGGRRRLETLVDDLGIGDVIHFPGPVFGSRKIGLLCAADVLVHPSRTEAGVPFSVLEAAALGRPCLLSHAADPGGILGRAGAALVVDPTVDSVAAGLRRMSAAPLYELRDMGLRARSLVAKEFSWPRTATILIEAYRAHARERCA